MPLRSAWCVIALLIAGWGMADQEKPVPKGSSLAQIPTGRARVVDLSYAINDKLVPWPGDTRTFESAVNASVEKDGYFTRSFWMLEHYGTHMDAPIHFPPGKESVDRIPPERLFGPAAIIDVRVEGQKDPDHGPAIRGRLNPP